jgi:hypothetical protein
MSDQTTEYGKPASSKEHQYESKWRSWKTLMIGNILELQMVTRSEVVVGEVRTAAPEFLVAATFDIHVAMQWISFESIAKCSPKHQQLTIHQHGHPHDLNPLHVCQPKQASTQLQLLHQ